MKTLNAVLTLVAAAAVAAGCTATGPVAPSTGATAGAFLMDAQAMYRLGRYLHGQQKYDEALGVYERLLAREPGHVDALNAAGAIHSLRGESQAAEQAFRRAIAESPKEARSYNNLGYHLLRTGHPSEALTQFQQAKSLSPRDEQVDVNIAMARARLQTAGASAEPKPAETQSTEPQPTVALAVVKEGIYELRNAPPAQLAPLVPLQRDATPVQASAAVDAGAPAPAPAAALAPQPAPRAARIEVSNGNGTTGLARRVAQFAAPGSRLTNSQPYGTVASRIQYTAGFEQAAREIGSRLPAAVPVVQVARLDRANVRVLLGKDFPRNPAAVAVARSEQAQPSHDQP